MDYTKAEIESLKNTVQVKNIIGLEKLTEMFLESREKMLDHLQLPVSTEVQNRLTVNSSVISHLNLLALLANTREGRKALAKFGITLTVRKPFVKHDGA